MRLPLELHSIRPLTKLIEVRDDSGVLLATLVPDPSDPHRLNIVSKYVVDVLHDQTPPVGCVPGVLALKITKA